MPVVVPASSSPSSSAQSLPGQSIYDYILDDSGAPVIGAKVEAQLNGDFTTSITPQVLLSPIKRTTTTDANGFWQLSLVPNTNISPANTTYTIFTPFRTYDITVGPLGPYQSTATGTLVSVPTTLAPATSGIIGPLSITGVLTVSAGVTIAGGLTVSSGSLAIPAGGFSMAGPLTLTAAASQIIPGATSMSIRNNANGADNLLVSNAGLVTARAGLVATAGGITATAGDVAVTAGNLTFGAAASRIVPGITSLTLRNNANSADNLAITDAGVATIRAGLTVTAGGLTVTAGNQIITAGNLTLTAGNLIFAAASATILPGATSLLVRNNADSATNVAITDAGLTTYRNALEVPPSAGGTLATHSYGTVPVKIAEASPIGGSFTLGPNPLPTGFRHLIIEWFARGDTAAVSTTLLLIFNNDSAANYDWQRVAASAAVVAAAESLGATSMKLADIPAATATAAYFGQGEARIRNYNGTTGNKMALANHEYSTGNGSGALEVGSFAGKWRTTATAVTRLDLLPGAGNFVTGTTFTLLGIP